MALSAPPWPGEILWDDTSVSSMAGREKARDGPSLSASSGGREFPDEDERFGILHGGFKYRQRYKGFVMSYNINATKLQRLRDEL